MIERVHPSIRKGFTLMETVIAIGVIALLITGFIAVFAPAVDGIRRSISAEEANRLASTLERELVTVRPPDTDNGFSKAFDWIRNSNDSREALIIYQYRGDARATPRIDQTPPPYTGSDGVPGSDFVTVSMMRRIDDVLLRDDLDALEGRPLVVRCIQMVQDADGALQRGVPGIIVNPKNHGTVISNANDFPESVLTFSAEFFSIPSRAPQYLTGAAFTDYFDNRMTRPMFTRNLAVRR